MYYAKSAVSKEVLVSQMFTHHNPTIELHLERDDLYYSNANKLLIHRIRF